MDIKGGVDVFHVFLGEKGLPFIPNILKNCGKPRVFPIFLLSKLNDAKIKGRSFWMLGGEQIVACPMGVEVPLSGYFEDHPS